MEERLDQLFKDKLGGLRTNPSEDAWQQIHSQLSGARHKKWRSILAIAASIALLITAGITSYVYISIMNPASDKISETKSIKNPVADQNITAPLNEPTSDQLANVGPQKELANPASTEDANDQPNHASENKPQQQTSQPEDKTSNPTPVVAKAITEVNHPATPKAGTSQKEPIAITQIVQQDVTTEPEETLPEKMVQNPVEANEHIAMATPPTEKTRPKLKIVYKASEDSELLASNHPNLINKGLKKITRFSDEHIITDEVKTKLRNTKDDLLALNFGKLLHKSNKDIDN